MKALSERLERLSIPEPNSGCVLWLGSINIWGYGQITIGGKIKKAHRVAYELVRGSIPKGLTLDHLCRVRCCINPEHLEPVSKKENVLRGVGVTAANRRKTHCIRGHLLQGDNLRLARRSNGDPIRACRACGPLWRKERLERVVARTRLDLHHFDAEKK